MVLRQSKAAGRAFHQIERERRVRPTSKEQGNSVTQLCVAAGGSLVALVLVPGCGRTPSDARETTWPAPPTTLSCPAPSSTIPTTETPLPAVPSRRRPLMVARYACDEKYEKKCAPGSDAFQRWLSGVALDEGDDLFKLEGGGPVGGQWNPSAALVLFVLAPLDQGKASVRVGHHHLRPATTLGDHLVYYVPQSTWERSGRRPRPNELAEADHSQRAAVSVTDIVCSYSDGRSVERLFVWANGE